MLTAAAVESTDSQDFDAQAGIERRRWLCVTTRVDVDVCTAHLATWTSRAATRAAPDPVTAGHNARTATEDSTAIAYIGELDSATSRTSVPITNSADVLQVAPGSGATDLVVTETFDDSVPEDVQATGRRHSRESCPPDEVVRESFGLWGRSTGPTTRSSRSSVVEAYFDGTERDSVLGTYSITEEARPRLDAPLAAYRVEDEVALAQAAGGLQPAAGREQQCDFDDACRLLTDAATSAARRGWTHTTSLETADVHRCRACCSAQTSSSVPGFTTAAGGR